MQCLFGCNTATVNVIQLNARSLYMKIWEQSDLPDKDKCSLFLSMAVVVGLTDFVRDSV